MDIKEKHQHPLSRRLFMSLGGLLLLYPLLRFINHQVPRKPQIIEVSGGLNPSGFLARNDFIIFSEEEKLWAVSRTCTHLGCRLSFKETEGYLECPCHQSRFTPAGVVLKGPAEKSLPVYKVELKGEPPSFVVTI